MAGETSDYHVTIVMPSAQMTGGSEESLRQLVTGKGRYGLTYDIIFLEEGPLVDWMKERQVPCRVIASGRLRQPINLIRCVRSIRKHLIATQTDYVLGWILKSHLYGGLAAFLTGTRCGWFQLGLPQRGPIDLIASFIPCDAIFACSDFVAQLQQAAQPKKKVFSVPLGVDRARFEKAEKRTREDCRRELGLPLGVTIVGTVGRLQHWKGMHLLIDAMDRVSRERPDVICVIVGGQFSGEPEYTSRICEQAKSLGLSGVVLFAGERHDIPTWMRAMDIFIHGSEREPFGIVVIEALSVGTPVISFSPSGVASTLRGLEGCLVLEERDSPQLAAGILKMVTANTAIQEQPLIAKSVEFSDQAFKDRMESLIAHRINPSADTSFR
jgi:glycosyltransferase involved in cell wall biosynthesis